MRVVIHLSRSLMLGALGSGFMAVVIIAPSGDCFARPLPLLWGRIFTFAAISTADMIN